VIKAIAVDKDGTFFKSDNTFDERYFNQLFEIMIEKHIKFIVASGNQYAQLRSFFPEKDNQEPNIEPELAIEIPDKIRSISGNDVFSIEVTITSLGNEIYPAASFSIGFDSEYFEFIGIGQGNVHIIGNEEKGQFPDWNVSAEHSNAKGEINIIYLDISGGRNAFSDDLLNDDGNVLFTLDFHLKENQNPYPSDSYEFEVLDAVFAASDREKSLASSDGTLKIRNGEVILEELND